MQISVCQRMSKYLDGPGLCFCLQFGVSVQSLELDRVNPGSAGLRFGERIGNNPSLACSEFGERPIPFYELWQVPSSEKGLGRTLVLAGSEFGERPVPFSKLRTLAGVLRKYRAEPWFGRLGVWRKDRPNPGLAGLEFGERPIPFSKLQTLAGSEFGERAGQNPDSAGSLFWERSVPFSELQTLAGWQFVERTGQNLGSAGSEGPNLTLTSNPVFSPNLRNKGSARSFLRTSLLQNQCSACSFLQTLN